MKIKVENINHQVLKEINGQYPDLWNSAKNKFSKIDQWAEGKDFPTYNQLVDLAKVFHIPFGYFFLDKLPEKQKLPIPHFRTLDNDENFIPSFELKETIQFAQKIQEWAKEILLEWGQEKLPFCGKYSIKSNEAEVIEELKRIFKVENDWARSQKSWSDAFSFLKEMAEEAGIIVLINGVVGNNTHRKLDVNEFRGFVLYDEVAPVIFINNNDAVSAKIFTLIHEVVHILIGQSASFDLRNLQSADNEIEKFCDECTAEFLVPESVIKDADINDLEQLARRFKVSQIVVLRRLLDVGKIDIYKFLEEYRKLYKMERQTTQQQGGNFFPMELNRLSKRFLTILQSAVNNNNILYRDALMVTNLKSKTYDKLIMSL